MDSLTYEASLLVEVGAKAMPTIKCKLKLCTRYTRLKGSQMVYLTIEVKGCDMVKY